ncbi:hypothetical protein [Aquipuribacter hungaricus]|uniref:Uncharacterized protein n=1 Tax=Aquipuribacter hungaricus TaxID=545624 RepID=A0ABV7WB96_9MICO
MTTEPVYPDVASNGDLVVPVRPPEAREAVAVRGYDGRVLGQRVVVLQPTAWVFDLRATSERYEDPSGRQVVDVAQEADYYLNGIQAVHTTLNASLVFVERPASSAGSGSESRARSGGHNDG